MNRLSAIVQRYAVPLKRAGAAFLVVVVLLLGVLQVMPDAHKHLHCDADDAGHACAITLFAHGVAPMAAELVLAVVVWRLLTRVQESGGFFVQVPAFSHLPGRAPPTV